MRKSNTLVRPNRARLYPTFGYIPSRYAVTIPTMSATTSRVEMVSIKRDTFDFDFEDPIPIRCQNLR